MVVVYRARSFVLVEVGELLLEHIEEVLSVGHLVRNASACRMLDQAHDQRTEVYTSGTPHPTASLGNRVALDLVIYRRVF